MTNADDQSRAAFEAWAKTLHLETKKYRAWSRGEYIDEDTVIAWKAWQAAIEHAASSRIIAAPVTSMQDCIAAQIEAGGSGRND